MRSLLPSRHHLILPQDVAKLLRSAGLAVKALTNHTSADSDEVPSVDQQKTSFAAATSQYFSLLSSIDVRLRRQIYALEEAKIVPAEAALKDVQGSQNTSVTLGAINGAPEVGVASQGSKDRAGPGGSGLGKLDVAWLNSRNDRVGKEMEAELWAEARDLVQSFTKEQLHRSEEAGSDVEMDLASEDPVNLIDAGTNDKDIKATAAE